MKQYEKMTEKPVTLFRNDIEPGSKKPKFSNGNVTITADLSPGRYSIGVWEWHSGEF